MNNGTPTVLWQVAEPWQGLGLSTHSLTSETPSNSSAGDTKKTTHISTPNSSPSSVGFQFDADDVVGREQHEHELRLDLRGFGRTDRSEEETCSKIKDDVDSAIDRPFRVAYCI